MGTNIFPEATTGNGVRGNSSVIGHWPPFFQNNPPVQTGSNAGLPNPYSAPLDLDLTKTIILPGFASSPVNQLARRHSVSDGNNWSLAYNSGNWPNSDAWGGFIYDAVSDRFIVVMLESAAGVNYETYAVYEMESNGLVKSTIIASGTTLSGNIPVSHAYNGYQSSGSRTSTSIMWDSANSDWAWMFNSYEIRLNLDFTIKSNDQALAIVRNEGTSNPIAGGGYMTRHGIYVVFIGGEVTGATEPIFNVMQVYTKNTQWGGSGLRYQSYQYSYPRETGLPMTHNDGDIQGSDNSYNYSIVQWGNDIIITPLTGVNIEDTAQNYWSFNKVLFDQSLDQFLVNVGLITQIQADTP